MKTRTAFALLIGLAVGCGSALPDSDDENPTPSETATPEPTAPLTPEPKAAGELSVLTYNVHGLPALITGDNTAERYQHRAAARDV